MKQLLRSPYFLGYLALYAATLVAMSFVEDFPVGESIGVLLVVGVGFSLVAHAASKSSRPCSESKPKQHRELLVLSLLLVYITLFLTFGAGSIQQFFAAQIEAAASAKEVIVISYKLVFFVLIPYLVYRFAYKFDLRDFGLALKARELFTVKNGLILVSVSTVLLLFQYFGGSGAKPIRDGLVTDRQLFIGLPLLFGWLLFEVGLVEEFFFRAVLQSRLAAILKSEIGGIFVSAVIFGLAHSPGIFLRGAGAIDNLGSTPSLITSVGYGILVLSASGFFLSIIWSRTRNLWLVMAIHAMTDLLPGLYDFVKAWQIK